MKFETFQHNPLLEKMVDILCNKTQNLDRNFYRTQCAFFLAKVAASMRVKIKTMDRGMIPVNIYTLNLASSGYGKGHSVNIIENSFLKAFKSRFLSEVFPVIAERTMYKHAVDAALQNGTDENEELTKLQKEFARTGEYPFTFDSGTSPAVKQLRHKLLLAGSGAINLQIDEIGSNLMSNVEVLNLFLELYDQGIVKQKLVKNTADNSRGKDIDGKTPTNMLLFGTPNKLFDGSLTEREFFSFLETGYARRCFFGWGLKKGSAYDEMSPEAIYQQMISPSDTKLERQILNLFKSLADPGKFDYTIVLDTDEAVELIRYRKHCETLARELPDHKEILKAEMSHRYFKVLKLAGAYAFVEDSSKIKMDHLHQAIKLAEQSGNDFVKMLNREPTYAKLARYIAETDTELTHADLCAQLPFYKSGASARKEQLDLAIAWGYKNNIIIKKSYAGEIEFIKGETLKETDLDHMLVSYSDNFAFNYRTDDCKFDELHKLTQLQGYHWCTHGFQNGHRQEKNVNTHFNMVAVDIDGGSPLSSCHDLLKEFKFMTYTTKRHDESSHRYRLIIPIKYHLELDDDEFKEFMNSFMLWLPLKVDEQANQRARKWQTHNGKFHLNDGTILDPLRFIPKTSKNSEFQNSMIELSSLSSLERWFAGKMATGNRNNHMIRFALTLADSGQRLGDIERHVLNFNKKLSNPLPETELRETVLRSVARKLQNLP